MKTKNNTAMNKTAEAKKYVFFLFAIYDAMDECMGEDMVRLELTEDDIRKVAEIMMEKNGGYPVDMDMLPWLQKQASKKVLKEDYKKVLEEDEWDSDWYMALNCVMPAELIVYAQEYITFKDVTQNVYVNVTGEEEVYTFGYRISRNAYKAMVEVLSTKVDGKEDFEQLKERYPEVYDEIAPDAIEQGFKWAMSSYHVETQAYLKEFPIEIYTELNNLTRGYRFL